MRKSRFTEEQIALALRQVDAGVPVADLCRKLGISEPTFYAWKKKFAGMGIVEMRRVKQLEDENRRLKAERIHRELQREAEGRTAEW